MAIDQWSQLASSLSGLRTAFDRSAQFPEAYLPDSPADRERQGDRLAGDWARRPAHSANITPLPAVFSVLDHLDSLGTLFRSAGGITTTYTVARAALDIATGPWYLLEPGIGSRERVRRYMNFRLQSLKEQMQLDSAGKTDIREHSEQRIESIIHTAQQHGFKARRTKDRYKPPYLDDPLPTTMELASQIVSKEEPSLGRLFWRVGSAVAHGHQYGFALFFGEEQVVDPISGDIAKQLQTNARQTALGCGGAPLAAIALLRRLYAQYGWETTELEAAVHGVLTTWRRVAAGPPPSPLIPDTFRP
ncbi:hypothetical protein H3146_24785 [Streptomyces sp. OF3]|uniref:Uncharacterized protein n=1 Tax=Streptomyces alkaliterrae TaxID=2213162 RepID=A0A7W3ZQB8_9ACTN|nr:hypothetical protein [Streptomyces alkaliterrae]MBB1256540.1 hypothetical protein [Streptomyces alkaliterrae]